MKKQTYFIGLCLNKSKTRATLQMRTSVDYLSCELYQFYGERETTKEKVKSNKPKLLAELKKQYPALISLKID